MQYAVSQHKLGMILTGDCGVGKTFVTKVLMNQFFDGQCKFAYIANPLLSPEEFLHELNFQLAGAPLPGATKPDLLHGIKSRLDYYSSQNIYVVVVIDEAQSIDNANLFEEIRFLLNLHQDEKVTFTLILSGQNSLNEKIEQNPSLKQRLSVRFQLLPLDLDETTKYINHRLEVTGTKRQIFTPAAYNKIFQVSGGKPRVINNLCDFCLLSGYMRKSDTIDEDIVSHVAAELGENVN